MKNNSAQQDILFHDIQDFLDGMDILMGHGQYNYMTL